ncbi:MAG: ABC transporter substrate-binding protein [Cytophagia bacterium]|nr:MAG: ABC transporter substrate-binding protein [Cytophagia bacterium]TAG41618.1 MAG: ABC transporter substrate-binding protein [Cytophagia bacterium]
MKKIYYFICLIIISFFTACQNQSNQTIKVGILHSLSGTMAISEKDVKDATLLAIEEINKNGGILGKKLEPIVVDGKSNWEHFAKMADSLIDKAKVKVVFGCWTSASRKTVKPVFEKYNHLLFYPVQYEGVEKSKNIVYTGTAPNQQIIPAVKWFFDNVGTKVFIVGSDYVYPRTASQVIQDQIKILGGKVVGDEYVPLGSKDVKTMVEKIIKAKPDFILNNINGDTNVEFFKALRKAGITPEKTPTCSFSVAEAELISMQVPDVVGDYAAWSYFQSYQSIENTVFIKKYKAKYGQDKVLDDPMETGYFGVYLWAESVRKASSFEPKDVQKHLSESSFLAPEGLVYIDGETQHTWRPTRIGKINSKGQFDITWDSEKAVKPQPYPSSRSKSEWDEFLLKLFQGWGGKWAKS